MSMYVYVCMLQQCLACIMLLVVVCAMVCIQSLSLLCLRLWLLLQCSRCGLSLSDVSESHTYVWGTRIIRLCHAFVCVLSLVCCIEAWCGDVGIRSLRSCVLLTYSSSHVVSSLSKSS